MIHMVSRRRVLQTFAGATLAGLPLPVPAKVRLVNATQLKPGQWEWYPERAENGPVAIVITLGDQLLYVYRNGIRIGVSTISSGKKGYETPSGVFTILRKERMHHSSKFGNAAMPDSQFFFGGAALHAGGLPGYPSSHGCVHLPRAFADRLFTATHNGTPVIITNEHSGTGSLSHAGLLLSRSNLEQVEKMVGNIRSKTLPFDSKGYDKPAFSAVASSAERKIFGFVNGELIFETPVRFLSESVGEHVYVLRGADKSSASLEWVSVGLGTGDRETITKNEEIAKSAHIVIPEETQNQISENLHPGSTFVITDLPAGPDTRTGTDFVVMRVRQ